MSDLQVLIVVLIALIIATPMGFQFGGEMFISTFSILSLVIGLFWWDFSKGEDN